MKCEKCNRPMTEGEPVYRLFINVHVRYRMVCAVCQTRRTNDDAAKGLRKYPPWQASRPCCNCSRPVFLDRPVRKGLRYFVCGIECRQAVHNANYRRWHPRRRAERQCECGNTFTPKRSDAICCKVACKQRAYRRACKANAAILKFG